MNSKIKTYFESLKPEMLGLKGNIKVSLVKKLGIGKNNVNFLVIANRKKFVFRFNILLSSKDKSRAEFSSLKLVEKLEIGPKAWLLDDSRKIFDSDFMILEYLEGKPLNETNYSIDEKFVKELVRLCIKFHSMPLKGALLKLPRDEINYKDLLESIHKRYISLSKLVSNKELLEMLKRGYDKLRKENLARKDNHSLVLTHGDICEQNIILHKGKMKLIDFESLGLTDPASEIAYIFTQFGEKELNEENKETFLKEYLSIRKDDSLRERVKVYVPLKNFADFLWAIEHVFKIKNKLVHKSYLEDNKLNDDIAYVEKVFNRVLDDGTIDKKFSNLDIEKIIGSI